MSKNSAHPSLNEKENIVAMIGGIGLLFVISAGLVAGFTTLESNDTLNALAIFGGAAIFASLVLWMVMLRPWNDFDDLQTPHFTGHEDHSHDEPH